MKPLKIALVGANTLSAPALLARASEQRFIGEFIALVEQAQIGDSLPFGESDDELPLLALADFDFSTVDYALFTGDPILAEKYALKAQAQGATVIDPSVRFRYDERAELLGLAHWRGLRPQKTLLALPEASSLALALLLKAIQDLVGLKRVDVVLQEPVSTAGQAGIDELVQQAAQCLNGYPAEPKVFARQIAFNTLPHVGWIGDSGFSIQENKLMRELPLLLQNPTLDVGATVLQAGVFYGYQASVHLHTDKGIELESLRAHLRQQPELRLRDDRAGSRFATPATEASEQDGVWVSRLKLEPNQPTRLHLQLVADNVYWSCTGLRFLQNLQKLHSA
jgi:aspartate-semialdehyde dehydrogenase